MLSHTERQGVTTPAYGHHTVPIRTCAPWDAALGLIAPGTPAVVPSAVADPEAGFEFPADPETDLRLILKDGRTVKRTL